MVLTSSPVGSDSWNRSIVIRQKTSLFLMCIRRRLKVGSKNEKDLHQLFEKIVHYPECGGWAQPLLKPVYGGRTVYKEMTNGAQGGRPLTLRGPEARFGRCQSGRIRKRLLLVTK